jgi:hypothetical protein
LGDQPSTSRRFSNIDQGDVDNFRFQLETMHRDKWDERLIVLCFCFTVCFCVLEVFFEWRRFCARDFFPLRLF